jgi:hypothetical protein
MKLWGTLCLSSLVSALSSCSTSYPYLVLTENCQCEVYTYQDAKHRFAVQFEAAYRVDDRIRTRVEIEFQNRSSDTLSLEQAYVIGTSRNIRYQNNGRAVALPFVRIPPHESSRVIFEGADTERSPNPWLKIAGERTTLEVRGLMLGTDEMPPVKVELTPIQPKLSR